jgi:hypothetical protein
MHDKGDIMPLQVKIAYAIVVLIGFIIGFAVVVSGAWPLVLGLAAIVGVIFAWFWAGITIEEWWENRAVD